MKHLILIILFSLLSFSYSKSQVNSCCSTMKVSFADFSQDKDFVAAHEEPIPTSIKVKGTMITFNTNGGEKANAYQILAKEKTNKYVFVFQEWWGLNDYIKGEADKIFDKLGGKINIIAIDMYDGKVATNREEAAKYMQSLSPARSEQIIIGAFNYVGNESEVATIGWCMGGGLSMKASILGGSQSKGCVMYYGMPEFDMKILSRLNVNVLGIFAENDKWITPEVVNQFQANMKELNKKVDIKMYKADHAFANPSNPHFHKEYTEDAMSHSIKFIKESLGI